MEMLGQTQSGFLHQKQTLVKTKLSLTENPRNTRQQTDQKFHQLIRLAITPGIDFPELPQVKLTQGRSNFFQKQDLSRTDTTVVRPDLYFAGN